MAEFGPSQSQCGGLARWCPTSPLLASTDSTGHRLIVRDAQSFEIVNGGLQPCQDKIDFLEWSPDGDMVLCACFDKSLVHVFSLSRPDWHCRIRDGLGGMTRAFWAPDSRHIISVSNFGLYMSAWSLLTKRVHQIKQAKPGGVEFSPDGLLMAVAMRRDCRDVIGIYSTSIDDSKEAWSCIREFLVPTVDLVSICWAPDGSYIAVQDTSVEYAVFIYSPEGRMLCKYQAYENAPGIKILVWHPSNRFLAVGSYDQTLRLLTPLQWRCVAEFRHVHPRLQCSSQTLICWREVPKDELFAQLLADNQSNPQQIAREVKKAGNFDITYLEEDSLPILPETAHNLAGETPRTGVGIVTWSFDGRYLASRNDNMPLVVWVWDTQELSLVSVLIQLAPIQQLQWSPRSLTLAIITGSQRVYFWNPQGASWMNVPLEHFSVRSCRWQLAELEDDDEHEGILLLSKNRLVHVKISALHED
jgi:WD40 repeat protein